MIFVINEKSEKRLVQEILKEEYSDWSDKVNMVKDYLDKNFLKANNSIIGDNGRPKTHDIVIWVDKYKQPKQYLNDKDLFYILQDEFKNILGADEDGKHVSRDKFLKQCMKDWYYGKITKNGCLTMYEGNGTLGRASRFDRNQGSGNSGSYKFMKWGLEQAAGQAEQLMSQKPSILMNWDDISIDGNQIIGDINHLLGAFRNKLKTANKNKYVVICDDFQHNVSETSQDYFNTLRTLYKTREAFKWCFICTKFAKGLDDDMLSFVKHQYNGTNIANGKDFGKGNFNLFSSLEERNMCIPYFPDFMKNYLSPYLKSELKLKVDNAQELSQELNVEIEDFLDSLGFEKTHMRASMLNTPLSNNNQGDDLDDF